MTLKRKIFINKIFIDFRQIEDSISAILRFSEKVLKPNKPYSSDQAVNIRKMRTIQLDTNIITGTFYDDKPSHRILFIYLFSKDVRRKNINRSESKYLQ